MSEKITFQELIESIAKETDNSKQFTHDFLKNFADIISDGLRSGEDINIAGFGKFKLQQVDERQGYNPQTEEKMTIPAHHKMVFKPYKDLREQVNEPYAHLESKLIEDDKKEAKADSAPQKSAKELEEELGLAPKRDKENESVPSKPADEQLKTETSKSFSFDEIHSNEEKEEDIVEFSKMDEELADFMGSEKPQPKSSETETIDEVNFSSTSPLGTDLEIKENSQDKPAVSPVGVTHRKSRKQSASIFFTAAAILLVTLAAGGSWYFLSQQNIQKAELSAAISATGVQPQNDSQPATNQPQKVATDNKMLRGQGGEMQQNQPGGATALTIAKGATLWSIAEEQLGNPRLWPWIYGTNQAIENPDLIFAGATLSVPRPSGQPSGLSASDSIAVAKGYVSAYRWYKGRNLSKAKNHLWAAGLYHKNIRSLAGVQIDKADLSFSNTTR